MRSFLVIILSLATTCSLPAQDITGQWFGALTVQGAQLRLVFNITKSTAGYSATLDSPDQKAKGIPVTATTFENPTLQLTVDPLQISYTGQLKGDSLVGMFKQGSLSAPLNLLRKEVSQKVLLRPQEPAKPYPYYSEEVTFANPKANIRLAGTLTLPKKVGSFPAVILITGSGPQNRDEEVVTHKPFLIISDYLTRHGIAVLRYDDRGTAHSTGDFKAATSLDLATDVEAAVDYLQSRKEINPKKIGLVGHSEGGLIAPMVAQKSKVIRYIVLLAGPGIPGDELMVMQLERIGRASGMSESDLQKAKEVNKKSFAIVKQTAQVDSAKKALTIHLKNSPQNRPAGMSEDVYIAEEVNRYTSPWALYFFRHDPATVLERVTCPVLALNGEKDLQVPAAIDLSAIQNALRKGGNKHVTVKALPNLNHLFQECTTGSPTEYALIEQSFSPMALKAMTTWIQQQTK